MNKKIEEILIGLHLRPSQIARGKEQLIELFMSCVPEEKKPYGGASAYEDVAWNDCREQMIENLEKLKI